MGLPAPCTNMDCSSGWGWGGCLESWGPTDWVTSSKLRLGFSPGRGDHVVSAGFSQRAGLSLIPGGPWVNVWRPDAEDGVEAWPWRCQLWSQHSPCGLLPPFSFFLSGKAPTREMACRGGGPRAREPQPHTSRFRWSESEDDLRSLVTPRVGVCSVALKPGEEAVSICLQEEGRRGGGCLCCTLATESSP